MRRWTEHKQHQLDRIAFNQVIKSKTDPTDRLIAVTISPYRPGWHQHRMSPGRYLDHDAADLYMSDRRGWSVGIQKLTPELLAELRARGATHLFYHLSAKAVLVMQEHPPLRGYLLERFTSIDVGTAGALFDLSQVRSVEPSSQPGSDGTSSLGPSDSPAVEAIAAR